MPHVECRAERSHRPDRPRHAGGRADAALLAAGGAHGRACRQPAGQAGAPVRRGPRDLQGRARPLWPDRPPLPASRHRLGLWPAGRRRLALRLSRLAVRRERQMSGDAGRAGRQQSLRQHQAEILSGGGEERHPVRLHGAGRAAGVSAFRLLHRARQPHLRLQGHDRLQLAAVAGGRHRSGAHLVPASLLPRRGSEPRLRQTVPRQLDRFRHADVADHARGHAPADRGGADRIRFPAGDAAPHQRGTTRMCASPT